MDQADWVNVVQTLWLIGLTFWVTRHPKGDLGFTGAMGQEGPPGAQGPMGPPGTDHTKDVEDIGRRLFVLENKTAGPLASGIVLMAPQRESDARAADAAGDDVVPGLHLPVEGLKDGQ